MQITGQVQDISRYTRTDGTVEYQADIEGIRITLPGEISPTSLTVGQQATLTVIMRTIVTKAGKAMQIFRAMPPAPSARG